MTKYTNNTQMTLPMAIWSLMDNYNHDSRDNVISVTTLLKPIRQIVLGRRYKDNMKEIDAENLIASSMGTALHDSVEKAWKQKDKVIKIMDSLGYIASESIYDEVILERRSEKEVGDYIISGQFDIAFRGTVCDIKSTSVYSFIYGSKEEDYKLQMSIYRWLNQDVITDDYGYIEYIFTDWSSVKAMQDSQYPQKRILSHKIELLSIADTNTWINNKLALIAHYEALNDDMMIECSDEELWRSEDKYKYYKPNKSGEVNFARATKVYDNEKDAESAKSLQGGAVVLYKGEIKRCKYCNYTNICNQYEKFKLKGLI
jgi:hypothetical protein